jgi:phospholipase C
MRIFLAPLLLGIFMSAAHAAPPFKHIVIVVQENRTPDNLFGSNPAFEPGVDIATKAVNSMGKTLQLTSVPLADCYDISHTHDAFEAALTQGFDQEPLLLPKGCTAPANPQFKYVDNSKGVVSPYFDIARNYGFANRMFQTNQGPSFPAHQFLFGATSSPETDSPLFASENMGRNKGGAGCAAATDQTVQLIGPNGDEKANKPIFPCFSRPTLTDLLDGAPRPIAWRYYSSGEESIWTAPNAIRALCQPKLVNGSMACTGAEWLHNVVASNPAQFLADTGKCNLADVSWVIPTGANSDHAYANRGTGPQWVASIVNAVGTQSRCANGETYWNDTVILITWDDWGGWYDHVKPIKTNLRPPLAWGDGYTYGFRVPLLVVSAYTQAGTVDNETHDFGSLVRFTELNFGLGTIGPGTTPFSNYADFHAMGDSTLSNFFRLAKPRAFVPINSTMTAKDFLNEPDRSALYPSDD